MSILIFALLIAFVGANVYVEAMNEAPRGARCRWWADSLSRYLNSDVDYTAWQRYAYLGWALAEVLLIFDQPHGVAATTSLAIAAAGLVLVTVTGAYDPNDPTTREWVNRAHKIASGFAFLGALVAELIYLWNTPMVWFPLGAVAVALAFMRWAPDKDALEEKAFTAFIVAGLLAIVGLPL